VTLSNVYSIGEIEMPLNTESALRKDLATGKADMQHRHFTTIAAILRNMEADERVCNIWADELQPTNPNFDRRRFLKACGY
jgi:hypothetical protein